MAGQWLIVASEVALSSIRLPELFDFVFTLPGLAWSYVNLSQTGSFLQSISGKLLEAGREVDHRLRVGCEAIPRRSEGPWSRKRNSEIKSDGVDIARDWPVPGTPKVVANHKGMAVVLKPRGWEVDGQGTDPCINSERLSLFMQTQYGRDSFPLLYLSEFDHGFIHRLDIPSSGLILTGTSFEGLYWIRWQLNVYYISREYYVMCQNLAPPHLTCIDLAIDVRTNKLGSHRSITSDQGGPAETWVCVTAHVGIQSIRDMFTPVAIRIRTGRKHQIRTHLRSSRHPSAVDGMYGVHDVRMSVLAPFEMGYLLAGCP